MVYICYDLTASLQINQASVSENGKSRMLSGGQKVRLVFSRKIKDTFFIFTNNFINLHILCMSAISHGV